MDDFNKRRKDGRYLSSSGIMTVLNQIMRAFFHSRLETAMDYYRRSPDFDGDSILIEPRADDGAFCSKPTFIQEQDRGRQTRFCPSEIRLKRSSTKSRQCCKNTA